MHNTLKKTASCALSSWSVQVTSACFHLVWQFVTLCDRTENNELWCYTFVILCLTTNQPGTSGLCNAQTHLTSWNRGELREQKGGLMLYPISNRLVKKESYIKDRVDCPTVRLSRNEF